MIPKSFEACGLSSVTLEAIQRKGFEEPTAIQALTIPVMLGNTGNIIAQAQTGTGKTAAFALPLLELITPEQNNVQALILVPTRELAIQVSEEINSLRGNRRIRTVPIYGGQSIDQQLRRLRQGVHIVVGTPGRVIDHLHRKTLLLDSVDHLIIDEADEMLNMGFIEDVEEIMQHTGSEKKTLLFSATMPLKVKDLAKKYMQGYELLKAEREPLVAGLTEQIYYEVNASDKFEALCRIIDIEDEFYGIVFCRTKSDVQTVASHLADRGYDAEALHGDVAQSQRERTLGRFKQRKVTILVATDVAARGIDVYNLTHVINYALPQDPDSYVHRIGRTGRAGNEGTAITFITPSEYKRLMFIQRMAKADIKKLKVPKVKDVLDAKRKKISDDLAKIEKEKVGELFRRWADDLLSEADPEEVVSLVLHYCFEEELRPESYAEIKETGARSPMLDKQGKARLFVAMGKKDRLSPGRLIDMIQKKVSVKSKDIRDIQIMESYSFVTVPFNAAEQIVRSFRSKGRKPLVTHAASSKGKGSAKRKDSRAFSSSRKTPASHGGKRKERAKGGRKSI